MKLNELNTIDNKFRYCDKQQHLELGSGKDVQIRTYRNGPWILDLKLFIYHDHLGHTVYFGLTLDEGKEVCVRKLKTKQLPQLKPNMIKKMLSLRHPNLLKYEQFCILKVTI